ncbi:MAG: OmpH family outer membrane protein [Candidatus Methylomirabilales bacterium]
MMRGFLRRSMLLLATVSVFLGVDAPPVTAQTAKIGFVDLQRVLVESQRGRDILSKLQVERDAKQREIEAEEKQIRQMEADLEKKRSVLSEAARKEKERDIRKRQRVLRRTVEDLNREFSERERELRDQLIKEVADVVRKYGKEKGYLLIMEVRMGGVLYGSDAGDVTKEVITLYDTSRGSSKR